MFTWDGPTRSPEDQHAELEAQWEADQAHRRQWFTDNVSALALRVELDLTVLVHEYDEATGAFQASLGDQHIGMLARRPRSDRRWDLRWSQIQHRWSTTQWDWALTFHHEQPTAKSIETLKGQLTAGDH